jgi:hypothetical protein
VNLAAADPNKQEWGLLHWQGALAGTVVGTVYGLSSFFLVRLTGNNQMGAALFWFFPFVVGATIALVTPRPLTAVSLISGTISLLICLSTLVAAKAEGILCALLSFPLILAALAVRVGVGVLLRGLIPSSGRATTNGLKLLVGPALLHHRQRMEMKSFSGARRQSLATTMHLSAPRAGVGEHSVARALGGKKTVADVPQAPDPRTVRAKRHIGGKQKNMLFRSGLD